MHTCSRLSPILASLCTLNFVLRYKRATKLTSQRAETKPTDQRTGKGKPLLALFTLFRLTALVSPVVIHIVIIIFTDSLIYLVSGRLEPIKKLQHSVCFVFEETTNVVVGDEMASSILSSPVLSLVGSMVH